MTQAALKLVPVPQPQTGPERLAALISEEFRLPVYYPVPGDPVLYQVCKVPDCPKERRRANGLCVMHARLISKWTGKSIDAVNDEELQEFIASPALNEGPKGSANVYSFEGIPEVVANELRYFLQEHRREGRIRLNHEMFVNLRQRIIDTGIQSVFDQSPLSPRDIVMVRPQGKKLLLPTWFESSRVGKNDAAILRKVLELVAPLYAQITLFDRDVWSAT